ncbi:hypothetical protein OG21DRAFT_1373699, partial [Imleria badia]
AESLLSEFQQGGVTSYIDEAIHLDRTALELWPPGHPERSVSLAIPAIHHSDRYDQLGATCDLEEVIVLSREGLGH